MKIKSEKGFTGVDLALAIVVLFTLISVLVMIMNRLTSKAKEIEYKSMATNYAVSIIENVKSLDFQKLTVQKEKFLINEETGGVVTTENLPIKEKNKDTGFYKTITVEDYVDVATNPGTTLVRNILKIVTVKITYQYRGQTQTVELSTPVSK